MKVPSIAFLVKTNNWFYCKVPPVLAIAYAQSLISKTDFTDTLKICFFLFLSVTGCAAYGHIVNDSFDIEQDRLAGKKNRMETLPGWIRICLAGLAILFGFLPFFFSPLPRPAAIVLSADYMLATVYSAPPFRWKEKAFFSVLTDATAVHLIPVLLVFALFSAFGTPFSIVASLWAFLAGLRGIIVHQLWDEENDVRAGVVTFVRKIGSAKAQSLIRRFLFPAEMITFFVVVYFIPLDVPVFVVLVALYSANILLKHLFWKKSHDPAPRAATMYLPPNDFYELWFPISLAIFLSLENSQFLLLLLLHMLIFHKDIQRRLFEMMRLIRDVTKAGMARR